MCFLPHIVITFSYFVIAILLVFYRYKWEIPVTFTSQSMSNFNQTDSDITWMKRDGTDGNYDITYCFFKFPLTCTVYNRIDT